VVKSYKRNLINLGLSNADIKKLKNNKSIIISGEDIGIDTDLSIFWEETNEDLKKELLKSGLITDETIIKED
jgi:hypothetical protein